jgi:hypothetical protein
MISLARTGRSKAAQAELRSRLAGQLLVDRLGILCDVSGVHATGPDVCLKTGIASVDLVSRRVMVCPAFCELCDDDQNAILAHELGHVKYAGTTRWRTIDLLEMANARIDKKAALVMPKDVSSDFSHSGIIPLALLLPSSLMTAEAGALLRRKIELLADGFAASLLGVDVVIEMLRTLGSAKVRVNLDQRFTIIHPHPSCTKRIEILEKRRSHFEY